MEGEIWSDLVHNLILKRKRSQRQRPFGASSSSSSEDDAGYVKPSSSEEHHAAKCLMLLARGVYDLNENFEPNEKKRKISGGLYECKTCNRAFPSFQALGGHRTSHKKIKIKTEQLLQQKPLTDASHIAPRTALQLESSNRISGAKARVHECLICGAEFASGQALGGHMRRHRVTVAVNSPTETTPRTTTDAKSDGITLSLFSPVRVETDEEIGNKASTSDNNEFQCLDLNLPASSSIGESQFSFGSKKPKQLQDSGLVFSSPALVDCHY
ncbi:hypothetical protein QQ045_016488 [Rhodiola kirilowii]